MRRGKVSARNDCPRPCSDLPEAGKARLVKIYDEQAARRLPQGRAGTLRRAPRRGREGPARRHGPSHPHAHAGAGRRQRRARKQPRPVHALQARHSVFLSTRQTPSRPPPSGLRRSKTPKPVKRGHNSAAGITDFNTSMNPATQHACRYRRECPAQGTAAAGGDSAASAPAAALLPGRPHRDQRQGQLRPSGHQRAKCSAAHAQPNSMGIEIVQPSGSQALTAPTCRRHSPGPRRPAARHSHHPGQPRPNHRRHRSGRPARTQPRWPPIEKPAVAPAAINEAAGTKQPAAQTARRRRQEAQGRLRQGRRILQQAQEEEGSRQAESLLVGSDSASADKPGTFHISILGLRVYYFRLDSAGGLRSRRWDTTSQSAEPPTATDHLCLRFPTSSTSASAKSPGSAKSQPTSCASGRASSRSSSPTRAAPASASTAAATSRWPSASRALLKEEGYTIPGARAVLKSEFQQKEPQLSLLGGRRIPKSEAKQLRNLRRELQSLAALLAKPIDKPAGMQKAPPTPPRAQPFMPCAAHAAHQLPTRPSKTPEFPFD